MRILVTADLHYDIRRSRQPARALAARVCSLGGDALVLAGDTAGADLSVFREALGLFEGFAGLKLLVAGNHGLWCADGETSLDRYERLIPEAATDAGFTMLDHAPAVLGEVGLVGSIGWYDYSMREPSLGLPEDFYRAKMSPGAAAMLGGCEELLRRHSEALTERHRHLVVRWMDGWRARLGMADEAFLDRLIRRLERQLDELSARTRRIIAFVHHLPFAELRPTGRPDRFAFAAAYMGSDRIGRALASCPKVTDAYCGHSHWPARERIGNIRAVNVGSTYTEKRLEVVDV